MLYSDIICDVTWYWLTFIVSHLLRCIGSLLPINLKILNKPNSKIQRSYSDLWSPISRIIWITVRYRCNFSQFQCTYLKAFLKNLNDLTGIGMWTLLQKTFKMRTNFSQFLHISASWWLKGFLHWQNYWVVS